LAEAGYRPEFGARPVKQAILEQVQNPLALDLLEGDFVENDVILACLAETGDHLVFTKETPSA